jgi:hypothetical protein
LLAIVATRFLTLQLSRELVDQLLLMAQPLRFARTPDRDLHPYVWPGIMGLGLRLRCILFYDKQELGLHSGNGKNAQMALHGVFGHSCRADCFHCKSFAWSTICMTSTIAACL